MRFGRYAYCCARRPTWHAQPLAQVQDLRCRVEGLGPASHVQPAGSGSVCARLEQAVEDILVKKKMREIIDEQGSRASAALSASRSASDAGYPSETWHALRHPLGLWCH